MASVYKSEVHIPVKRDSLSFQDRQWSQWRGVEERMEERRKQWQEEFERMRQEMFVLKPTTTTSTPTPIITMPTTPTPTPTPTTDLKTSPLSFTTSPSLLSGAALQAISPPYAFHTDSEGRQIFRIRFEVSEFQPEEVTVKVDGGQLMVQARHEEKTAQTAISKQYSRQVDIPAGVEHDKLSCTLSKDGVLTVEAPVSTPQPQFQLQHPSHSPSSTSTSFHATSSSTSTSSTSPNARITTILPLQSASPTSTILLSPSSPATTTLLSPSSSSSSPKGNTSSSTSSSIITTTTTTTTTGGGLASPSRLLGVATPVKNAIVTDADGSKRMVLKMDVSDFLPEEVIVRTVDRKLMVTAEHEERTTGRTMHKEFNKEYDLPESVDPSSITAHLSEDRQLIIEAPIKAVVQRKVYEVRQTQDVHTHTMNKDSCVTIADSHNSPVVTISVLRK